MAHGLGPAPVVVARALHAGIDMDMVGEDYLRELPIPARDGLDARDAGLRLSLQQVIALIERACHWVLRFKARLGFWTIRFGACRAHPRRRAKRGARWPAAPPRNRRCC
ncbi:MAG: hypothetical protein U1E55_01210 [Paracoccus sp. (in: a-proteobacteria)]